MTTFGVFVGDGLAHGQTENPARQAVGKRRGESVRGDAFIVPGRAIGAFHAAVVGQADLLP